MKWSSITKFLLGSTLGLILLVTTVLGAGYLVVRQFSSSPPKPIFANDPESVKNPSQTTGSASQAESSANPEGAAAPEDESYQARVIYPQGLILRDIAAEDANRIGGIGYNEVITILEKSEDGRFQRVRLESGEEGWVSAGNVERVN